MSAVFLGSDDMEACREPEETEEPRSHELLDGGDNIALLEE